MRPRRRTTFWRYNLRLEVALFVLASAILFAGVWFSLTRINRDYLDLRLADADRVHAFLENQLDEARASLARFTDLPPADRTGPVLQLFTAFSDIYCLDSALRVAQIHKAVPNSKVFPGFSFSGGKLGGYLRSLGEDKAASEIMRGYEDDASSIYLAIRHGDYLCLGRLNLDFVRKFLIEFSQFSGAPLMLTASDGFVMLSGDPALPIAAIDFHHWAGAPNTGRTLTAGGRRWIPLIAPTGAIGARILMLVPTDFLDTQRNTLLAFVFVFMGAWFLLVTLKNLRFNRLVMQPLRAFAARLRDLEQDQSPLAATAGEQRFAELAELDSRFRTMAAAIAEREQSLRASEEKYRTLAEDIADVIWTLDVDALRFLYVSPAAERLLGRTPEAIMAEPVDAALTLEAAGELKALMARRAAALLSGAVFADHVYRDEIEHPRQDGTRVWTEAITRYYRNEDTGRVEIHGVTRDISERKAAQVALILAKEQADAANRAKSAFLANMSHEIRTPLNAILGFAQVLARDPVLNNTQRDSLATIRRSGEHLLTLINDILDMAKIEAGRMSLQSAPFDLPQLLTETQAIFQQRARARGLDLTLAASVIPPRVTGDAQRLRQVLINLIGNAIKFTPAGGIGLRVEPAGADQVRFSVSDTGVGIAPDELRRLFEPFSQTASGRQLQGGTGLGLALSHQFVRLMGGQLSARNTPGAGTCFSFTLPLPAADDAVIATDQSSPGALGLEPGQPVCRLLIVDDLADNRAPLRALLETVNPQPPVLEFREAADGQEAVRVWEDWQPHLIFMDLRMPVLSGEEATRQIKSRLAARPGAVPAVIVALTASAFDEQRERVLASGCDAFARKPFQAEELFGLLERLVGLRFLRAGHPPPCPEQSRDELNGRLSATPAAWRAELRKAVVLGDFERINTLLEGIRATDAALHASLVQSAYNYDLEAFTALFGAAGAGDS
ncbi:MAG: ATP-binding protein [Chromatiaceae bacterium]